MVCIMGYFMYFNIYGRDDDYIHVVYMNMKRIKKNLNKNRKNK